VPGTRGEFPGNVISNRRVGVLDVAFSTPVITRLEPSECILVWFAVNTVDVPLKSLEALNAVVLVNDVGECADPPFPPELSSPVVIIPLNVIPVVGSPEILTLISFSIWSSVVPFENVDVLLDFSQASRKSAV
jgi:hypothetical protein